MQRGTTYELIVRAIYHALLNQTHTQNVEHNIVLQGRGTKHQIDVYWKFTLADVEYTTIVSVRNRTGRTKKGELLEFKEVLDDISGQPRGIFVSSSGYQRGAIEFASSCGIILIKLVRADTEPNSLAMTSSSIAHMQILPNQMAMRITIKEPSLSDINIVADQEWLKQYETKKGGSSSADRLSLKPDEVEFCDDAGNVRQSLHTVIQDCLKTTLGGGQKQIKLTFEEPTLMKGVKVKAEPPEHVHVLDGLRIRSFAATLKVTERTTLLPLGMAGYVSYVMGNIIEGTNRFVLVTASDVEPKAIVFAQNSE